MTGQEELAASERDDDVFESNLGLTSINRRNKAGRALVYPLQPP